MCNVLQRTAVWDVMSEYLYCSPWDSPWDSLLSTSSSSDTSPVSSSRVWYVSKYKYLEPKFQNYEQLHFFLILLHGTTLEIKGDFPVFILYFSPDFFNLSNWSITLRKYFFLFLVVWRSYSSEEGRYHRSVEIREIISGCQVVTR